MRVGGPLYPKNLIKEVRKRIYRPILRRRISNLQRHHRQQGRHYQKGDNKYIQRTRPKHHHRQQHQNHELPRHHPQPKQRQALLLPETERPTYVHPQAV